MTLFVLLMSYLLMVTLVWLAIVRLRKWLGMDTRPTSQSALKELGGYVIVGFLVAIALVAATRQEPQGTAPGESPSEHRPEAWTPHPIAGGQLSLSTPSQWELGNMAGTELYLFDLQNDLHLFVHTRPKEDLAATSHSELSQRSIEDISTTCEEVSVRVVESVNVGPFPATRAEVFMTSSGYRSGVELYAIDFGDRWGEIRGTAMRSRFDSACQEFQEIVNTVRRIR